MRGRLRELTVGLGLSITLLGCSNPLGQVLGDKVETGTGTTPTVVAPPPRMTASTTTTTTTLAPGTSGAAASTPLAPSTAQRRDPAVSAPAPSELPPTSIGTVPARTNNPTTQAPSTATSASPTTATRPRPLEVSLSENPFRCDGARRAFGTISNAAAGERVSFVASGVGELVPGTADGTGNVTIHWRCDANDAGTVWSVTATGLASGRSASFDFKGAPPPATTAPPGMSLAVSLKENPFRCDGELRAFGTISGATPGESVSLSEISIGQLNSGVADANGQFPIKWRCSAGATWSITGRGTTSGRSVTFSFSGA